MELGPAAWHLYPPMGLLVQTPTLLKADTQTHAMTSKWRQHRVSTAIFVLSCVATTVVLIDLTMFGNAPTTQPVSVTIASNATVATAALGGAASRTGDLPSAPLREVLVLLLVILVALVGAGAYLMHRRTQSATPIKALDQEEPKPVCLTVVSAPL
ncbi:hypothetical protein SPRG_16484 [Saprolegnia parasitica CBS 223.65]|uniref:Uncharacterized protein n=1 Tax=Saprolegnia parasitica (strain CBS 223.65) TaxID=695850 RepID=A0A067BUP3_SAPPC|nr:hypothetical protein SPRG_16484 [Saprolegnia parasitica CBS 223.65]KDO18011.1 hypothetical protein SPRG_16484 [Saprolegnia parasitica CBS 223.65]|eukprot:XP_012211278.1 hypothetical protein SPRG_16484 [Saprolegnia parasitica CBS 223.65]